MSRTLAHAAVKPSRRFNYSFGDDNRPDVEGFLREDAENPGGLMGNIAASDRVKQQRNADMLAGNPTRAIGGPLPDTAWDAFFGALQQKEENAQKHNLRFRANLAGSGPGEGIGHLGFINAQTGMTEHPLDDLGMQPSVSGLNAAASRLNRFNPNRRF